jgi:hypothetical protein
MVGATVISFLLGICVTFTFQGVARWARARGTPLTPLRWVGFTAWAALLAATVLFATASWGEAAYRAAVVGGLVGLVLVAATGLVLWRALLGRAVPARR